MRAARRTTGASTIRPRREMTPVPISRARAIASITSSASSISCCFGRKTSWTTSICRGFTRDLPVKPSRFTSSVSRRSPSMSPASAKMLSIACTPAAFAAQTTRARARSSSSPVRVRWISMDAV